MQEGKEAFENGKKASNTMSFLEMSVGIKTD